MVAVAIQREQHTIARKLENIYIDDCNYSATTEEELREIKKELPLFIHEHEFPVKALTCTGKQDSRELSSQGFINTTIILQESEYRIPDTIEEDSEEKNNDVP